MSKRTPKTAAAESLTQALAAPFEADEVKFKPQVVKGNRALALAYVDARAIQDRLDDVLGVEGWQDEYTRIEDGSVMCRLQLRLGDEWITKMDVGSPSEQPDVGDRTKAAFSDALKRAAVKFGIGRYLYRLPQIWCDYDPVKKQFLRTPTLPGFATPPKPVVARPMPADGTEFARRLRDYDAKLANQGVCEAGALVRHVAQEGVKAGHGAALETWGGAAIELAAELTKAFEAAQRRGPAKAAA